jgi:hypothetical protein
MTASTKMQHDETAESPFYIRATAIPAYRPRTLKDGDTFLLVDLAHSPSRISLPRKGRRVGLHIVLFEACSAFTHVAACTLVRSPMRDPLSEGFSHPAGAVAGWGLHPLESAALARRTPEAAIPGGAR